MKILIYGINFSPELTGIGKYTGEMAEFLSSKENDVTVVTAPPYYPEWRVKPGFKSYKYSKKYLNGMTIYRCPLYVPNKLNTFKRILHLLSFSISSSIILISKIFTKPDVVIVIAPSFLCAPFGIFFCKITGAKSVIHFQDFEFDAMFSLGMMKKGFLAKLFFLFEKFIIKKFDLVTTISRKMIESLKKKGISKDKIYFFPNWVDIDFIKPEILNKNSKKIFSEETFSKVVLYSGNIGNKQGLEIIIDVAELMQPKENLKFIICGSGANKEKLINYSNQKKLNNIKFMELVSYDELPNLINAADIHLVIQKKGTADAFLPSKLATILGAGGFSIVTAENDSELGILNKENPGVISLVNPEDKDALKDALIQLLNNSDSNFNVNARIYAEKYLNKNQIINSFIKEISILKNTNTV